MTDAIRPKFIADHMLGSLARWLRMLGYDTVYDRSKEDIDIIKQARSEGRFILTRDRELAKEPGALMVDQDNLDGQLRAVAERYGLRFSEETIRCSACNGELEDLPKDRAKETVPAGALEANEKFWRCKECGKVYWKGTHWNGIMERLKRLNLG